jgi:carbon monoxide dehydrogenase subunit G
VPEVEYTTKVALGCEVIWEFVKDMNNWAPYLTGYQKHEIIDETDSVWTLKGDVGVLARIVKLRVHVTEWSGPTRVSFTLTGLNEPVDGGGTLEMFADEASEDASGISTAMARPSLVRRWINAIVRFFFRRAHGPAPVRSLPKSGPCARLTFRLRMEAGGPTGPLVNAMLGPALLPAAEDLANKIAAHLEREHARAAG